MRCCGRIIWLAVVLGIFSVTALAIPMKWTLVGVTFNDGGTASGSFVFDADAGVRCNGLVSPCGTYSSVNITTTPGTIRTTGATYNAICTAPCNGVTPDAADVLFLGNPGSPSGNPAMSLFPSSAMTDLGGTSTIFSLEANCSNATCSAPFGPTRTTISGSITTSPIGVNTQPASSPTLSQWGMILFAMLLAAYAAFRMRGASV